MQARARRGVLVGVKPRLDRPPAARGLGRAERLHRVHQPVERRPEEGRLRCPQRVVRSVKARKEAKIGNACCDEAIQRSHHVARALAHPPSGRERGRREPQRVEEVDAGAAVGGRPGWAAEVGKQGK